MDLQLKYNSSTMTDLTLAPRLALLLFALPALACRPVIAVGWGEILIFIFLFLLLFGLPFWRFWKKWQAFQKDIQAKKK